MKFLINAREMLFQALLDNADRISCIDFKGEYPERLRDFFPRKFIKQLKKKKHEKANKIRVIISESLDIDFDENEKIINVIICKQYKNINKNKLMQNYDLIMVAVSVFDLYLLIIYAFSILEKEFRKVALVVNRMFLSAAEISQISLDILKEQNKERKSDESFLTIEFNEKNPILILTTSIYANTLVEELIIKRNLDYHLLIVKQLKPMLNVIKKRLPKSRIVYVIAPYPLNELLIGNFIDLENVIVVSPENIPSEIPITFDLFEVFNDFYKRCSYYDF